ncbi:MAG: hypothetical protein R2939_09140 [Kofleriaceae bacterium]
MLFYQERIQSSVVQGRQAEAVQRDIGDRYRELLLARSQLDKIVNDPELGFAAELAKQGPEELIEELRLAIDFESRGANTFRISYGDADRDRAQAVTQRLTELLQQKEEEIRSDQARSTAAFAESQKAAAADSRADQRTLSGSRRHPGVRRRAQRRRKAGAPRSTRAAIAQPDLQRQQPRDRGSSGRSRTSRRGWRRRPTRGAAHASRPRREDRRRRRGRPTPSAADGGRAQLEEVRASTPNLHPDVVKARAAITTAQAAAAPGGRPRCPPTRPTGWSSPRPTRRSRRPREEAGRLEQQLTAGLPRRANDKSAAPDADDATNWVVELETEYAELRRAPSTSKERVQALSDTVTEAPRSTSTCRSPSRARASQPFDPAFRPIKPFGRNTRMLVLAGLVLFVELGAVVALVMAILDDRLCAATRSTSWRWRCSAIIPSRRRSAPTPAPLATPAAGTELM